MFSNNTGGTKTFVTDSSNREYGINMADSFNFARNDIHSFIKPLRKYIDIEVLGDEDIKSYDLRKTEGYIAVIPEEIFIVDDILKATDDFNIAAGDIFIPGRKGKFRIYYKSEPDKITEDTSSDYIIEDDSLILNACVYYCASRLYMEDDSSIAIQYLNTYENLKNTIAVIESRSVQGSGTGKSFVSERGWI